MSIRSSQILALQNAAQLKKEITLTKVQKTLQTMEEKNIPINFNSVAKLAQVSKTWLYKHPATKKTIEKLRSKTDKIKRLLSLETIVKNQVSELEVLINKNKELTESNKKLRYQLEIVYGKLYKLKNERNLVN